MQSPVFAKWVREYPLVSHVLLPAVISLLLIGMYFSGISILQNFVAPRVDGLPLFSSRELGALEILQNVVLLCIIAYSVRCFISASDVWIRTIASILVLISIFTFMEEIDYGAPFIEYFTGQHASMAQETWTRNWHNRVSPGGKQYVDFLKIGANFGVIAGFVLVPLFFSSVRHPTIRLLVPSRWVIATVVLIALLRVLARVLENSGLSMIDGNSGSLYKNLSEFRELNLYYLFLLYVANLYEQIVAQKVTAEN